MSSLPDPKAQNTNSSDSATVGAIPPVPTSTQTSGYTKEQESVRGVDSVIEEVGQEIELAPELERAGVQKLSETIELPPDVRKMGVSAGGPAQPITHVKTVKLPLRDDQIEKGLHAQIISSLRWLAEWCVRQLKKAHIHLKKIQGKIIRENN